MACAELTAFRTAVESLDQRVLRSPRLGRANFWRNMIPKSTFVKNQGVTRSTFQIKPSEPQDDQSLWYDVTLSSGNPSQCTTNYEDLNVNFFERTYSPKKRQFRGPVICRENLTFQHNPEQFLNAYEDEMGKLIARIWEFSLRGFHMYFGNVYVDGTKYAGPNALATAPRAYQGLSQDALNVMATGQINLGAGAELDGGYTTWGDSGPMFPLEIDMVESEQIFRANSTVRQDARDASSTRDGDADFAVWKAIGSNRKIGNYRHVPTPIAPRFNYTGGAYVQVSPFKDVTAVGTDGEILTTAYKNAAFGAAIQLSPRAFTAEVVLPSNWKFPNDARNYNGELNFITGGERICSPAEYDPEHNKGRHFGSIEFAPRPDFPWSASMLIYKRCAQSASTIFCS